MQRERKNKKKTKTKEVGSQKTIIYVTNFMKILEKMNR